MMLPSMPAISVETGAALGARDSFRESGRDFDRVLRRTMAEKRASAGEGPSGKGLDSKGGEARGGRLSLEAVLERIRVRWGMLVGQGGDAGAPEKPVMDLLRQMIAGSGADEETKNALLEALEGGGREKLSLGRLLEKLKAVAEGSGIEEDDPVFAMGEAPFLYTLLRDMGIPEDRVSDLLGQVTGDDGSLSLEALGREWGLLRQDLTEGRLMTEAQGLGREDAIRVLDHLLDGVRALDAAEGSGGFSRDTAALLERSVLAALKEEHLRSVLSERPAAFRLTAEAMGGRFLREVQPGGDPAGVTEERVSALGKGVYDAAALEEGGIEKPVAEDGGDPAGEALREKGLRKFRNAGMEKTEAGKDAALDAGSGAESADSLRDVWDAGRGGGRESGAHGDERRENPVRKVPEEAGDRGNTGVAAFQGLRAGETAASGRVNGPTAPPPAYVMDQVSRKMAQAVQEGQNEVTFQLKPENLGRLQLRIEQVAGGVNVRILAEQKSAQEVLNAQVAELKAQMQEQGLRVERIEVSVAPDFDSALFRERERERESRRPRQREAVASAQSPGFAGGGAAMPGGRGGLRGGAGLDLMA